MDEHVADTYANRDEPIPVINLQSITNDLSSSNGNGKNDTLGSEIDDGSEDAAGGHKRSHSLQDRLFARSVEPC